MIESLHRPMTSEESSKIPDALRYKLLREAKPGTWYDGWAPYCMSCATMHRMKKQEYGFKCGCCGNMLGWDLHRLADSPLNKVIK